MKNKKNNKHNQKFYNAQKNSQDVNNKNSDHSNCECINESTQVKQSCDFKPNLSLEDQLIELQKELDDKNKQIRELTATNQDLSFLVKHQKDLALKEANEKYLKTIQEKAVIAEQKLTEKIAEFQNKYEADLKEAKKYFFQSEALTLLNIVDQFEAVLSNVPQSEEIKNFLYGFQMFLDMFKNLLDDLNIKKIEVHVGAEFNPETMEAFETVSVNQEQENNKVVKVVSCGYQLHDRVIKPAIVKVGLYEPKS